MADAARAQRVLIRAGKDPRLALTPEEVVLDAPTAGLFGKNAGNMLFHDAMHRILSVPGTEAVVDQLRTERGYAPLPAEPLGPVGRTLPSARRTAHAINASMDRFVLPLANAFRASLVPSISRLTDVIEHLRIPVVVVGVGVQRALTAGDQPLPDEVAAVAKRFLSAVLDRSDSVGVRGAVTGDTLKALGFDDRHIDVIGCPSLFAEGTHLAVTKADAPLTAESSFTVNVSPYVHRMNDFATDHAGRYPSMTYIPQVLDDLRLMLWAQPTSARLPDNAPQNVEHRFYRENRMRFFVDSSTWIDYLRTQQFSIGSRIHGNIAALRAGTPAFVLAHDTRTLEIAEYHEIPHHRIMEIPDDADAADFYAAADYTGFNAGHADRFAHFVSFLDRNDVPHIFTPGSANPAYDAALAAVEHAPAVEVRFPDGPGPAASAARSEAQRNHDERIARLGRAGRPSLARRLAQRVRRR